MRFNGTLDLDSFDVTATGFHVSQMCLRYQPRLANSHPTPRLEPDNTPLATDWRKYPEGNMEKLAEATGLIGVR